MSDDAVLPPPSPVVSRNRRQEKPDCLGRIQASTVSGFSGESLPSEEWSDKALLRYLQEYPHEQWVFSILYDRHVACVHGRARRYLNHADSWDVTQDFFVYLWERLPALKAPYHIENLSRLVVRNKALNVLRKQRLCQHWDPEAFDRMESELTAENALQNEDLWDYIQTILSAKEYRFVVLRFRDGLSYADIARIEAMPLGTVKRTMHEIKVKIKGKKGISIFRGCAS